MIHKALPQTSQESLVEDSTAEKVMCLVWCDNDQCHWDHDTDHLGLVNVAIGCPVVGTTQKHRHKEWMKNELEF